MGNDHTLALIAKAAKKLARLDPEFAANVDRQRRARRDERRRLAVRALTREFDRTFTRLTRSCEAELTFDPSGDVEAITAQDAVLVSLDTAITAPGACHIRTRLQKALPASERPGGTSVNVANHVTVNANGGTPAQNADLAKQLSQQIDGMVRGTIADEMRKQMRPGNSLSRN